MVLFDSGSTHNFINRHKDQQVNYFFIPMNKFQVLIVNGSLMKCGGHSENVKLQIGDYNVKTHMFVIDIGGVILCLEING